MTVAMQSSVTVHVYAKVTSPSRLHFGLWSLGGSHLRQFGGVGLMIDCAAI